MGSGGPSVGRTAAWVTRRRLKPPAQQRCISWQATEQYRLSASSLPPIDIVGWSPNGAMISARVEELGWVSIIETTSTAAGSSVFPLQPTINFKARKGGSPNVAAGLRDRTPPSRGIRSCLSIAVRHRRARRRSADKGQAVARGDQMRPS